MLSYDSRKKNDPGSYRPLSLSFVPGKLVQMIRKKENILEALIRSGLSSRKVLWDMAGSDRRSLGWMT